MNVISSIVRPVLRKIANRPAAIFKKNRAYFDGKLGLEIGGASEIFSDRGPLPVYTIAQALDNINFSSRTFWSEAGHQSAYAPSPELQAGKTYVVDSDGLANLASESYDFVVSSHVVEHLANPIKNVLEWRRLTKRGGAILIVAPYKRYSYDRRREITKIDHLISDFENNVSESDDTHFDEVLKFHDLSRDNTISQMSELRERTLKNAENRILHHHVFDSKLLLNLGARCDLKPVGAQIILPRHVVALFRKPDAG